MSTKRLFRKIRLFGMHTYIAQGLPEKAILHILSISKKSLGCLISAIPMMVEIFIVYSLNKLNIV